jgi:hypothetical protein
VLLHRLAEEVSAIVVLCVHAGAVFFAILAGLLGLKVNAKVDVSVLFCYAATWHVCKPTIVRCHTLLEQQLLELFATLLLRELHQFCVF